MSRHFGIFAKRPQAGHVKTRLAADFGAGPAAEMYEAFLRDLVERFHDAGDRRILGYAPDDLPSREFFTELSAGDYDLWPQPSGDLGHRIARFFESAFDDGANSVVLIGSDSPTLPTAFVPEAFRFLDECDCVLGPAPDGGYYLIGLRRRPGSIFDNIEWSGPQVMFQTIGNLSRGGFSHLTLPEWDDVDTLDDLRRLDDRFDSLREAYGEDFAPRTQAMLEKHIEIIRVDL